MILTVSFPVRGGVIVVQPPITPLAAKNRLENEGPFVQDLWDYEWDDDTIGPLASFTVLLGDPRNERVKDFEFYANGEPGDPVDENSFWVLV